jgi:DHA1 family inner membrane transport protein
LKRVRRFMPHAGWFASSFVVAVGVTVLITNTMIPTLVGVYVDSYGLSIGEAGYTAAAYMTGGGLGAALVSWLLLSVRTRVLLVLGLFALAIGNLATVAAHSLAEILALRVIAGVGEGMGFALMGAAVSRMTSPNRVYGVFVVLMLLAGAGVQYSIPWMRSALGARMLFVPIAVMPACLLLFVGKFPDLVGARKSAASHVSPGRPPSSQWYFWSGVLATIIVYIAFGASFTYIERIGISTGIAIDTVAGMLGMGYLVSVVAALAVVVTANKGPMGPKLSISLAVVAGATLLTVAGDPWSYRIGVIAAFFSWYFFAPNLLAVMSLADPSGRLAAAVMGAMECGLAIGPAIAALWIRHGSYGGVAVLSVGGYLIGMLLLVPVLRHLKSPPLPACLGELI